MDSILSVQFPRSSPEREIKPLNPPSRPRPSARRGMEASEAGGNRVFEVGKKSPSTDKKCPKREKAPLARLTLITLRLKGHARLLLLHIGLLGSTQKIEPSTDSSKARWVLTLVE